MYKIITLLILLLNLVYACAPSAEKEQQKKIDYAIVIHGGAGYMSMDNISEENRTAYLKKLEEALETGLSVLKNNGSSVDAVEKTIRILEDSPLFNAGKGAVFTHEGINSLDASIMEGASLEAGAVAGVKNIKNPISAARKVMDKSPHVLLSGDGASEFASLQGLEIVDPDYFFSEDRFKSLLDKLRKEGVDTDSLKNSKFGTVGCVALDKNGNIAAGTSTGGMTNKKFGRIGDSPIIGAGTYANNSTCGVSCTGHGEFFIRYAVAHEISALMKYKELTVEKAAEQVIHDILKPAGGDGGVICLDQKGNYAMEFNTSGMFRAYGNSEGDKIIGIFKNPE